MCFAFGELPPGSLRNCGGAFRPVGLASLQPARRRRRQPSSTPLHRCLLPDVAHVHVHTAVLDLTPMQQASTQLNWPAELQALADDPDSEAVIAGFRDRLADYGNARPSADTRLVPSRGLIWRTGERLPTGGTYEHTQTIIPLIGLMRASPEVTAAFGRCLAGSKPQQNAFLLACIEKAGLTEQQAMIDSMPQEQQDEAVDAMYGHINLESGRPVIIALPSA
jgi:hypothetical protein